MTDRSHASESYRQCNRYGMDGCSILSELLYHTIHKLRDAQALYQDAAFEPMAQRNSEAITVLIGLADAMADLKLRDAEAAPVAVHLQRLSHHVILRIANVLRTPDVAAEYEALIELLLPFWRRMKQMSAKAPVMAAPATMPLGSLEA